LKKSRPEPLEMDFWLSFYSLPDKRMTIQVRKVITDPDLAKYIAKKVLEYGELPVRGVIKLRDPLSASIKLKLAGILK